MLVGQISKRRVLKREHERTSRIGELPIDKDMLAVGSRAIELHAQQIEQHLGRDRSDSLGVECGPAANFDGAMPQLVGTKKVRAAPRSRFCQVAELFIRVSRKVARLL